MALADLMTPRGETLTGTPWTVYPRPQLRRDSYVNLNGTWDFTVTQTPALPKAYDRQITVPFCPESALSGIGEIIPEGAYLYYRRNIVLPEGFQKDRVLLHIGAADQIAEIYVNQRLAGNHVGGYESFCLDITHLLEATNELVIRVQDTLSTWVLPYGKQTPRRGGMWYTPVSGIWQTVWLESVPQNYVNSITIQTDLSSATVTVTPALSGSITCDDTVYPLTNGCARIYPAQPRVWSPENPYLYSFTLSVGEDQIESYFALRTLETKTVKGIPRLCLNGKPYFFHGLLDQGYWPDGLFTPAAPECYAEDILAMKKLGFNTLRKHIKVEPEQFYYDCDRLGMVVFQDMVNNGDYRFFRDTVLPSFFCQKRDDRRLHRHAATRQAFLQGMTTTVEQLKNHPCICCWTIFNEGWGQFDSTAAYSALQALDSSRFIDTTSGWFRGSQSDVESLHIYFSMWHRLKPSPKPLVLSEFGGFVHSIDGHIFNPDKAYGYGTCRTKAQLMQRLEDVYRYHILPWVEKGLCASIYTQLSDVEDETNGLITYDRKLCKVDAPAMQALAQALRDAIDP